MRSAGADAETVPDSDGLSTKGVEAFARESATQVDPESGVGHTVAEGDPLPAPRGLERTHPHFHIRELLGRGGIGVVYRAHDERLKRDVALKVLRPERAHRPETRFRLQREAQLLSQLAHPHICQIYDYVEGEDADVLVLECVEGRTLGEVMGERLSPGSRMGIALEIADVLVAAHNAGVVHRDLKPGNVMLTDEGHVKVLDFGIARSVDPDEEAVMPERDAEHEHFLKLTDSYTRTGSVLGTPRYMSPEQARGEPVTAAADMFSFGVLLQELFTTRPAYAGSETPQEFLDQVKRGETLPVAGLRSDLRQLIERLKAKEPGARPSAQDAADKLRHIQEAPKRRRLAQLKAAAVATLVLFAGFMAFQAYRVRQEAAAARRAEGETQKVVDFLVDLFRVSDPSEARGSTVTARELLDRGAETIRLELAEEPLPQARLMETIGRVYRELGLYDEARSQLDEALAIRQRELDPGHPDIARSLYQRGQLHFEAGEYGSAEASFRQAAQLYGAALGADHRRVADSLDQLAVVVRTEERLDEAEAITRQALAIREKEGESASLAVTLDHLASVLNDRDRPQEAQPIFERALELRRKYLGADHPAVAMTLNGLAITYVYQDQDEAAARYFLESLELRERIFGPDHPDVGQSLSNLGWLFVDRDPERAKEYLRRASDVWGRSLGPRHPRRAQPLTGLGDIATRQGHFEEAEAYLEEALSISEESLGPDHTKTSSAVLSLARLYEDEGRLEEAEAAYRRCFAIRDKALPADHRQRLQALEELVDLLPKVGKSAEADELQEQLAVDEQ